jgi:hypothetical protein
MLTSICQTVAQEICGSYKPSVKVQSADKAVPHLHRESATHSSARLFKDTMRGRDDFIEMFKVQEVMVLRDLK